MNNLNIVEQCVCIIALFLRALAKVLKTSIENLVDLICGTPVLEPLSVENKRSIRGVRYQGQYGTD